MSIFKGTFRKYVQNQINIRQNNLLKRNDDKILTYLNNRTCNVRLTSSVNIDSPYLAKYLGVPVGNSLAKLHVLENGELYYNQEKNTYSQRYGIGDKGGAYGDKYNGTRTLDRGINPMSGITGVSISSKSAYGTLQQATISIRCNSIKELERLELLYCRVGYTLLLEYSWSIYFDNNNNYQTETKRYSILEENNLSKEQIFKDIYGTNKLIESSSGNYDALYGYVTNFSWSNVTGMDNCFDITVELLSIGEIIDSLKTNYISALDLDGFTSLDITQKESIQKDVTKSKLHGMLSIIKEYSRNNLKLPFLGKNKLTYKQVGIEKFGNLNMLVGYIAIQDHNIDEAFSTYIKFSDFIELMNNHILLSTDKKTPFIKLSLKDKQGEDNLCFAHYFQIPTDLNVCHIESCKNVDLLRYRLSLTDENTFDEKNKFFVDEKYNRGIIGNIYLNIDFLIDAITESQVNDSTTLMNYLTKILSNVNRSLGYQNDFKVVSDHESDLIRIIDATYIEGKDDNSKFVLELSGLGSTVRSYALNSAITPNMSSMTAISAGVNSSGSTGVNTNLFDLFNLGLSDRIIKQRIEPDSKTNSVVEIAKQTALNLEIPIRDYTLEINSAVALENSRSSEVSQSLKEFINLEIRLQAQQGSLTHSTAGILPIKLSITLDGIGGIRIGDVFKIPESSLPIGYRGFNNKNRIGFIVTRLSHSLQNNDWVTILETQTVILDEKGSYSAIKKAKVYEYSPFLLQFKQVTNYLPTQ